MFRIPTRAALLGLLLTPSTLWAQPAAPGWSIGLGMAFSDSPYAGEGTRVRAFPFLGWQGDRAYLRGLDLGIRAWRSGPWSLDLALSGRLDGFDARDLGRSALAVRGVDRDRLNDRDDGVDASATVGFDTGSLNMAFELRHDLSGASDGGEARLRLGRPLAHGAWRWTPFVEARWLSADLAGYYYGIHRNEAAQGVPGYRPGSALRAEAGVTLSRRLGEQGVLFGTLRHARLPNALSDSPLLEDDSESSLFLAFGRRF